MDDNERQISYFKWDERQPGTENFIHTTEILISKRLLQGVCATDSFDALTEWKNFGGEAEDN